MAQGVAGQRWLAIYVDIEDFSVRRLSEFPLITS